MRTYWKVVRKVDGEYYSLFSASSKTLYRRKERTFPNPNCGPLIILKTLKSAKRLKERATVDEEIVIIKLNAKLLREKRVWKPSPFSFTLAIHPIMRNIKELEETNSNMLMPGHTKLAEWVEVIGEVK